MAFGARVFAILAWLGAMPAVALAQDEAVGPSPWETGYQTPATRVMEYIDWFSWYTVFIMSAVVLLVIGLVAWCVWRYNERRHTVPSRITHNTTVEVLWTVIPVLVLVAIAIPSFRLLYGQYDPSKLYPEVDPQSIKWLTVKVTGVQWAWNVDYSNDEDSSANGVAEPISLFMTMIPDDALQPGQVRNLSVDNPMVVPVDTFVKVQVTADGDAIHSFAMPAFGIKTDAIPGRLNETYFRAERQGLFFGQCSELCGKDHAFMPFNIIVVSPEKFRAWAAAAPADPASAYQTLAKALESERPAKQVAAR
jgi:cytochrome c oxidase subunit 2